MKLLASNKLIHDTATGVLGIISIEITDIVTASTVTHFFGLVIQLIIGIVTIVRLVKSGSKKS